MGVMKLCSSSSADRSRSGIIKISTSSADTMLTVTETKSINLPNPKPDNYTILNHEQIGEYVIVEIQYHDCTNYEGRKILVFKCYFEQLVKQQLIDPHFCDSKDFLSPIARFEPTANGWDFALKLVNSIQYRMPELEFMQKFIDTVSDMHEHKVIETKPYYSLLEAIEAYIFP